MKCPYKARDEEISQVTVPYLKLDEATGKLQLKTTHSYYYQVQGQLFCANKSECDFVIYTKKDFLVISVSRDQAFIDAMLLKLSTFFNDYFKPAVVNKLIYRDYYSYNFMNEEEIVRRMIGQCVSETIGS